MSKTPRGRYAPSPTGHQTVANAYLAIRAWLDVRARGGDFVLRIDDTDPSRTVVTVDEISRVLHDLGITYDEGWDVGGPYAPYIVSERGERHRAVAERLVSEGHAYWDYTPPLDDAESHRKRSGADRGRVTAYRGSRGPVDGVEPVLRLAVEAEEVVVVDRIFGELRVKGEDIGEVALLRSDGRPTYHLASCVDDVDMAVTTVVRGADWLNFLPQHVLLYDALGAPRPEFAHVPLLFSVDGTKLGKRQGDLSIKTLVETEGLPAGGLVCYLAMLGFEERPDLLTLDELCDGFELARMGRASPKFDPKKMQSVCRRWLAEKEPAESIVAQVLDRAGEVPGLTEELVWRLLPGIRGRIGSFADAAGLVQFVGAPDAPGRDAALLPDAVADAILAVPDWDAESLEAAVAAAVEGDERKARLAALRAALAPGFKVTPPLHYVLLGLGRERARARLAAMPRS